jgi:hypothetical protein
MRHNAREELGRLPPQKVQVHQMQYDNRDGNYHGTLPNGDEIVVDGDLFAEEEQKGVPEEHLASPLEWESVASTSNEAVRIVKK